MVRSRFVRPDPQSGRRLSIEDDEARRLKAILTLALETIPQDPSRADYRQGDALGASRKHWFGAKFFQQYRLFFRYDSASRIIVNFPRANGGLAIRLKWSATGKNRPAGTRRSAPSGR